MRTRSPRSYQGTRQLRSHLSERMYTTDQASTNLLNSAMLIDLPADISLDAIVTVYTTPPIPATCADSSASASSSPSMLSGTSNPPMPGVEPELEAHLPVSISVFDSHPTFFSHGRFAVISFDSIEDFRSGFRLFPPSMYYRPGSNEEPRGEFVKPEERNGSEVIFQCNYRYGYFTWMHEHPIQGKSTWKAVGPTSDDPVWMQTDLV